MSPRYRAKGTLPPRLGLEAFTAEAQLRDEESRRAAAQGSLDPYRLQHSPERFDATNWRAVEDPPSPDMLVPSFWHDLLLEFESNERAQRAIFSPALQGRDQGDPNNPTADRDLAGARERLRTVREFECHDLERAYSAQRDITSAGFIAAAGAPMFIADAFATAARGRAALAAALPQRPLPAEGDHIEIPRLASGSAAAVVASENAARPPARSPTTSCCCWFARCWRLTERVAAGEALGLAARRARTPRSRPADQARGLHARHVHERRGRVLAFAPNAR